MNTYELFKTVETHLLTQGKKSQNNISGNCYYRGPDQTKCAVGFLIKDEFYSSSFEGDNISGPEVRAAVEKSIERILTIEEVFMLKRLQQIHDGVPVEHWYNSIQHLENTIFGHASRPTVKYKPEKYPPTADQMFKELKSFMAMNTPMKPINSKSFLLEYI